MANTEPRPGVRGSGGGYHKRPKDYITVEECIILVHHHVGLAMQAHRQAEAEARVRRTVRSRLRARWRGVLAKLRKPIGEQDEIAVGIG